MKLKFSKMHGAGNDFIVADNNNRLWPEVPEKIQFICDRHRGIGADGLILISNADKTSIKMDFYNCDGSRAEMCGNGLRCAANFAHKYFVDKTDICFETDAGRLNTEIISKNSVRIDIPILEQPKIHDLSDKRQVNFCNTGVPHVIIKTDAIDTIDVKEEGKKIRYDQTFAPAGTNVNFISESDDRIKIRTYERGVEDETLACGTGIAAAAVSLAFFNKKNSPITFITANNEILTVELCIINNMVQDIKLTGPAVEVFSGNIDI